MIFLGKEISKARILKRLFKSSYEKKVHMEAPV